MNPHNDNVHPIQKIAKLADEITELLPADLASQLSTLTRKRVLAEAEHKRSVEAEDNEAQAKAKQQLDNVNKELNGLAQKIKKQKKDEIKGKFILINGLYEDLDVGSITLDPEKYNVDRANGQTKPQFIKKIHEKIEQVNKEQKNVEELFLKLKQAEYLREMLCPAVNNEAKKRQDAVDALTERYKAYNGVKTSLREQFKKKLLEMEDIPDNSVVVYIWYLKGVVPGSRKMMGMDSTGHIGVAVKHNGETKYLSFYPQKDPNAVPSWRAQLAKKMGFPSPDPTDGVFRPFEEDLYRRYVADNNLSYWQYQKVVIPNTLGKFDVAKAMARALELLSDPVKYAFFKTNCASIGVDILRTAGADIAENLIVPDSPGAVFEFSKAYKAIVEEEELATTLGTHGTFQVRINKRIAYIKTMLEGELAALAQNDGWYNTNAKTPEQKEVAKKMLEEALQKISAVQQAVHKCTNITEIYEILNHDQLTKFINNVMSFNQKEGLNDEDFRAGLVGARIKPLFASLRVLLPSTTLHNAMGTNNAFKIEFVEMKDAFEQKITTAIVKLQITEFLGTRDTVLRKFEVEALGEQAKKQPRNTALLLAKHMQTEIVDAPRELQKIVVQSEANYLRLLEQHKKTLKKLSRRDYKNLFDLSTSKEDVEAILNKSELDEETRKSTLATKLSAKEIEEINNFSFRYCQKLSNYLGVLNAYLYFDSNSEYDDATTDNVLVRARDLLGLEIKADQPKEEEDNSPNHIQAVVKTAMEKFKRAAPKTTYDQTSQAIYVILEDNKVKNNRSYQETKSAIEAAISQGLFGTVRGRKELHALHYQAQLTAAMQAFIHGRLSIEEFAFALYETKQLASNEVQKGKIDRFVELFRLQAHLDDVSEQEKAKKPFEYISPYLYHEYETEQVFTAATAQEFKDTLPENISPRMQYYSTYRVMEGAMAQVFAQPLYSIVLGDIGLPEIRHAFCIGLTREEKNSANNVLNAVREKIERKQKDKQTLTDAEKIFHDFYLYLELYQDLCARPRSFITRNDLLSRVFAKCLTQQSDPFYSQLVAIKKIVESGVRAQHLDELAIIEPLRASKGEIEKLTIGSEPESLRSKLTTTKLRDEFASWKETQTDPANIPDRTEPDGLFLKNLADITHSYNHTEKLPDIMEDFFKSIKNDKDFAEEMIVIDLMRAHQCLQTAIASIEEGDNLSAPIMQLHQDLKNNLEKLLTATPITETVKAAQAEVVNELQTALGIANRLVYLEDPNLKKQLTTFLGLGDCEKKSIRRILHEASMDAHEECQRLGIQPENHYKLQLVALINEFAEGQTSEKDFYGKLNLYTEQHRPYRPGEGKLSWLYNRFNFVFNMFWKEPEGSKFAAMPSLLKFRKLFVEKYSDLEAKRRPKTELVAMQAPKKIERNISNPSLDPSLIFENDSKSEANEEKDPKKTFAEYLQGDVSKMPAAELSRLKRFQVKVSDKLDSLFSRGKKIGKMSDKSDTKAHDKAKATVKANLKQGYYAARETELEKHPALKKTN